VVSTLGKSPLIKESAVSDRFPVSSDG
jgi:hypothetical protein